MNNKSIIKKAAKAAFPHTIPILAGFTFLGAAYGIYMRALGFAAIYPICMSMCIFAGSMEFLAATLLLGAFNPLHAFLLTVMVNARHIFYGISMLDKYKNTGKKKWYLIFGMCDESFSINCTAEIPADVDKGWFMFFVTLYNQIYWVTGATIGGLFGNLIPFDTKGIEFVMTALFIVIFINQWQKESCHESSIIGFIISIVCLFLFGRDKFIIATMVLIFLVLSFRRKVTKEEAPV